MKPDDATVQIPLTYLDSLLLLMRNFLLARIIHQPICRPIKEDTKEIRIAWAHDLSWVIVAGIISALVQQRDRDIDSLWDQAEESIRRFAIEDFQDHPKDGLRERFNRWARRFMELPPSPEFKKTPGAESLKPYRLVAYMEVFRAEEFLRQLSQNAIRPDSIKLKEMIRQAFPTLQADEELNCLAEEILKNDKPFETACSEDGELLSKLIATKSFRVKKVGTFERRYISGALTEAEKIDKLLNLK
jgi:hypothetical protein